MFCAYMFVAAFPRSELLLACTNIVAINMFQVAGLFSSHREASVPRRLEKPYVLVSVVLAPK